MPTRDRIPAGSPCWADLSTSDVEGSRRFYSELFGWKAEEPNAEFGGYFMFTRDGLPTAGGMGDMGDMPAQDVWKIFICTDDIAKSVATAETEGGTVGAPPMPVADLGTQAVLVDPTGAALGLWQPGTFQGFSVLAEPGTPSWYELHTRDYAGARSFYASLFGWEIDELSGTDSFRYSTVRDPAGGGEMAGILDASAILPDGVGSHWTVYWKVDDARAAADTVRRLGGSVRREAEDSPYGVIAVVADPAGAEFRLHTPNR
ncbi:MAG TPA: VOC family protein [Acidimicrobiales bacterium]|nr:VOC family protein [Acidimicrobiales bacterium]